jgi:type II secretory ATPase GspE/PulE/Tfp pilus assembly ATPase PilB-like protein
MRDGLVSKDDLEAVLREQSDSRQQRLSGRRLGEILVARGLVTEAQVAKLIAEQYELPFVEIETSDIDLKVARRLSEETTRRFSVMPISERPDGSLLLVVADPATVLLSEALRQELGASPRFAVVGQDAIAAAIAYVHERDEEPVEAVEPAEPRPVQRELAVVDLPPLTNAADEPYLGTQRTAAHLWPPLGALLIREGLVSDAQLETALAQQRLSASRRLGEILVDRGILDPADIARLVAEQYELPFVQLGDYQPDSMTAALLPEHIAREYSAVPTGLLPDGSLRVLVADPSKVFLADEFYEALGVPLNLAVAAPDAIEAAIESLYGQAASGNDEPVVGDVPEAADAVEPQATYAVEPEAADAVEPQAADTVEPEAADAVEPEAAEEDSLLLAETDEAAVEVVVPAETHSEQPELLDVDAEDLTASTEEPVDDAGIEASADGELDSLIERALALGASSIHFSPQPTGLVVRARIDGVMRELDTLPGAEHSAVTSRLKAIAAPTTSERIVDLRIETVSTKRGDKVTLRIHGGVAAPTSFTDLGMAPDNAQTLQRAIHQPFGAIVVCGPAGSGRTTTLYAALHELNTPERTLTTIEDPIEHLTLGIDQIEVDPGAGMSFARGLDAILQTDSDVVLVGEIRDEDTARSAVRAAMTDSLVLAGLQAPTAAAGVQRLAELGVEPGLLASTLTCVVAQRLVRRICRDCRETHYAAEADLAELGRPTNGEGPRLLARGRGCATCGETGFSGRIGIFEVLPLSGEVRTLVDEAASTAMIQRAGVAVGMRTLREEGIRLCLEGLTTPAEVRRVAGDWLSS